MASATGDGREDGHLGAVVDLGLEALLEADVLAADVDVDEAAQVAVLGDPLAQPAVRLEDGVEDLANGRATDLEFRLPPQSPRAAGSGSSR